MAAEQGAALTAGKTPAAVAVAAEEEAGQVADLTAAEAGAALAAVVVDTVVALRVDVATALLA